MTLLRVHYIVAYGYYFVVEAENKKKEEEKNIMKTYKVQIKMSHYDAN